MKFAMKFLTLISLFLLLVTKNSLSEDINIKDVIIVGNIKVSNETILSYAGIKRNNQKIQSDKLNLLQKKIYESNFFSEVQLSISGDILKIKVSENPIVDYFFIEGLESKSDYRKEIEKKIFLRSDVIYSEFALNKDINFISNYLSSLGYLNNKIEYEIKKIDLNKVNVFLKINLNNQFHIKNIFFIGDKKFSSSKLLDVISSSQKNWFSFFSSTSIPSTDRLNYDISKLKNFYLSEGYYDVQISNASINIVDGESVNITFAINAGELFIISDYTIKNTLSFLKEEEIVFLNNSINKLINQNYNFNSINLLNNALSKYLEDKGIAVTVNYEIKKISKNKIQIVYDIDEINLKKIISNIVVTGNEITDEKVIRNNIYFSEGDVFLKTKINSSIDKLKSINIFKDVKINYEVVDDNFLVKINVEEKPTGEISSGLSVGTGGSSISFAIKENNFFGQGIYTDVGFSLGTNQVLGNISFSDPDFNNSGNTVSNSFYVTKTNFNDTGFENKVIGDTVSIKYEIFKDLELENGLAFNYDQQTVSQSQSSILANQDGNFLSTKYFYNVYNDKRNRKFQPTSGYTFVFGQGLAFPPSDIPLIANTVSGSFYREISENYIGSIKYKLKSVNSFNNDSVKLSDRVFVSSNELRGFSYRGIGPKVGSDFIGGNYSYTSTFSSTIPNGTPDSWKASTNIFIDVANVWGADFSGALDSNQIRSSVGVGLSWFSPLGPITFSYAEPISKSDTDKIEKFNFRLGGAF